MIGYTGLHWRWQRNGTGQVSSYGNCIAPALGVSIFAEADTVKELWQQVRDAASCDFEDGGLPSVISLHALGVGDDTAVFVKVDHAAESRRPCRT